MINKLIESFQKEKLISIKDILLVIVQFGLIILHFLSFKSKDIFSGLTIENLFGLSLIISGLILIIISLNSLGQNISALPQPREKSNLITRGIYSWIRHPMYLGLISISLGNLFFNGSLSKLTLTILLIIVILIKVRYEEEYLIKRFPNYIKYKKKVKL